MTDNVGTQATMAISLVGSITVGGLVANRYEIRGLLGAGGMGAVFRAHDRELDEEVALKIIKPEVAAAPDAIVRFRLEVKLARRIAHPSVARTYDLGDDNGIRYLTMELVDGPSLRQSPPLAVPEVLRIASEISLGLAAVHAGGVVHRDLKPDNILLVGERVVITDFGIARGLDKSDALMTSGNIVGTPAYIAPEQLEGGSIDGRADVYALGVMLYELVARRLPFDGDSPTAIACARLVQPPIPLRSIAPQVSEGFANLLMDMLARRKDDRPDAHTVVSRIARLRGIGGGGGDSRTRLSQVLEIAVPTMQRTVRIAKPDADEATRALGGDLVSAITDALAKERVKVVHQETADESLEATVRAVGDRVRIRLRLLDPKGETVWAERVEGSLGDPFAIEDAVAQAVVGALRARGGGALGPEGPIRARFETARDLMSGGIVRLREGIQLLEQLDVEAPDNAWVSSLLARALVSLALQTGGNDEAVFGRAEELALRALDRDPTNAHSYQAIAVIRSVKGEHAGAIAASREALRRSPMLSEAHYQIGRVLCWGGRVAEGLQRVELAMRLDPKNYAIADEKIRVLALIGDRAGAERELARIEAILPFAGILPRLRLFSWWADREVARVTAELMVKSQSPAAWQAARPIIEAYGRGEAASQLDYGRPKLEGLTSVRVVARHRAFMHEISAEMLTLMGAQEDALDHVVRVAALPSFINLLWIDRCPNLAPLRARAEFAQARASVAERVAQLLE